MNHILAIVEREMRKFFRSPALMMASMVFPLVQLIVLGNAFGGKIRDAKLGLVDQDGGTQALKIREAFDSTRMKSRRVGKRASRREQGYVEASRAFAHALIVRSNAWAKALDAAAGSRSRTRGPPGR